MVEMVENDGVGKMYIFQMVWLLAGIVTLSAGLAILEAFWRAAR